MNILIIQENGRHEANRDFRECFCIKRAFEANNQKATIWGLGHPNFNEKIDYNSFDLIINLENYDDTEWVPDLSKTTKPIKFLWSIDAHVKGIDIYKKEFYKNKHHKILQSTLDFVQHVPQSVWMPNCFDDSIIKPLKISKNIDIGFCGNFATNERKRLLDFLTETIKLKQDIFIIGQKMVEAVNSYKIHFNINISNDINYRSFETIGCRTVLCTNYNHQYEKLGFKDMVNCILYKNTKDIIDKTNHLLTNPFLLNQIATSGHELSAKHTYSERVKNILKEFNQIA